MKAFSFSMQKILDFREVQEKQAELELGKANAEVARIQNELNAVAQQRVNVTKEVDGSNDIALYASAQNYFKFLKQKEEQYLEEIAQAQLVAEEKKKIVREAMQKVKVLDKLKEKKRAEWQEEYLQQEELAMDDVVTAQYNGKK
jgi:flagellar FliJ protein